MTTRSTLQRPAAVERYLSSLDRELTKLPRARARELRAELVDHLDQVVPAGASDPEALRILRHVGEPSDLVAEALGGTRPLPRWRRVRLHTWIVVGTVICVLTAATVTLVTLIQHYAGAAPLRCVCAITLIDNGVPVKPVISEAGGVRQLLMPAHTGHRLGFAFAVVNDSDVTQTILGPDDPEGFNGFEGDPRTARFEVSTMNSTDSISGTVQYAPAPAVLAPHTARVIRVSNLEPCAAARETTSMWGIGIRVRVGAFTHAQQVHLSPVVAIKRVVTPGCPFNGPKP